MKKFLSEAQLPLTEAAKFFPGRPHKNSLVRWATRGIKGVCLESWVFNGRRYTSEPACERFKQALFQKQHGTGVSSQKLDQAKKDLDALGVR